MAEGFARAYGVGCAGSAERRFGSGAGVVASLTHKVMLEKNIDLGDLYPKEMEQVEGGIDLIINMSGDDLPCKAPAPVEIWDVRDPIGESDEVLPPGARRDRAARDGADVERLRARKPAASVEALPRHRELTLSGGLLENKSVPPHHADVAELADALDSGSSSRKGVEVQVLSSAPKSNRFL